MGDERHGTVRGWLREAAGILSEHDSGSGHEAAILLESVLGIRRSQAVLAPDRALTREERSELDRLVEARLSGMPLQYLTRSAAFRHLDLAVGPGVFVPRPETEGLVDLVLEFLKKRHGARVLELCMGSGAILAALLTENPTLSGVGVELSPSALRFARTNIADSGAMERAVLHAGDLYEPLPPGRFAVVVANPPYIPDALWEGLPRDVRDHEPREALLGGADGTDIIRRIVTGAPARLEPGGLLAMEIDVSHGEAVRSLIAGTGHFDEVLIEEDLTGRPRYARAIRRPISDGGG